MKKPTLIKRIGNVTMSPLDIAISKATTLNWFMVLISVRLKQLGN